MEFYNFALVDIRLPDIDGVALLKMLRQTMPRMRKIVMTGFPSIQNAIEAIDNTADGYMLKPFEIDITLAAIREQLRKQQEEREYNQKQVSEFVVSRIRELEMR